MGVFACLAIHIPLPALADNGSPEYRKARDAVTDGNVDAGQKLLEVCDQAGDFDCTNMLGNLYMGNHGHSKDVVKAAEFYLRAADGGNGPSQYNIAVAYELGHGVEQDFTKAARYHRIAAEAGYYWPMYRYAHLLEHGLGVKQDYVAAAYWYEKSSSNGYAPAAFELGKMYESGRGKIIADREVALKWFFTAKALGHKKASEHVEKIMNDLARDKRPNTSPITESKPRKPPSKSKAKEVVFSPGEVDRLREYRPPQAYRSFVENLAKKYGIGTDQIYVHEITKTKNLDIGIDFEALVEAGIIPWKGLDILVIRERARELTREILFDALVSGIPFPEKYMRISLVKIVVETRIPKSDNKAIISTGYRDFYGRGLDVQGVVSPMNSDAAAAKVKRDFKTADGMMIFRKQE